MTQGTHATCSKKDCRYNIITPEKRPSKKKRVLNGKEVHIHEDQQWKQVCINEKKKKKKKKKGTTARRNASNPNLTGIEMDWNLSLNRKERRKHDGFFFIQRQI